MSRRRIAIALAALAAVAITALLATTRNGDDRDAADDTPTRAHALALDRQGRVFAAIERLDDGGGWRTAVARERDDGSLDQRFALDVRVENPAGIAVDRDGAVLVAGDRVVDGRRRLAIARVRPDGRPDARFGTDGVATIAAGTGDAVARGIAVGAGRIVIVGDAHSGGRHTMVVARLDRTGGDLLTEFVQGTTAGAVAVGRDGEVLVAGTRVDDGAAVLGRLRSPLGLVVTRARTRLTTANWRAIAATPDGGAVVVGSGRDPDGRSRAALQRFGPDGAPASSAAVAAGDGDAYGSAAAVQPDGRILVGATGQADDRPAAYAGVLDSGATAPAPLTRRADGRLAGLAAGPRVLTTVWDGTRQRTAFER